MEFRPQAYGARVADLLHLEGDGRRLMPLTARAPASDHARALLQQTAARELFPHSRAPEAALAGLYLYFDCWKEAHETAQDIATPEGSYWHAIVHRQEPDAGNASYWFRQVGNHPIFPALRDAALALGFDPGPRWKPDAFLDLCEQARQLPDSPAGRQAREIQRVEWQLLFHHCAGS